MKTTALRYFTLGATGLLIVLAQACGSAKDKKDENESPVGEQGTSTTSSEVKDLSNFKLSSSLALVTTSDSSAKLTDSLALAVDSKSFSAESDFAKDVTKTYVRDIAFEPLDQANTILCFIDQMAFGDKAQKDFLAAGEAYPFKTTYVALIDESKCESKGEESSSSESSGSVKSPRRINVYVERENETAALKVAGYLDDIESGTKGKRTKFKIAIGAPSVGEEAKDDFGQFEMDYATYKLEGGKTSNIEGRGVIDTIKDKDGKVNVLFVMEGGDDKGKMEMLASAKIELDANGKALGGQALTKAKMTMAGGGNPGGGGGQQPGGQQPGGQQPGGQQPGGQQPGGQQPGGQQPGGQQPGGGQKPQAGQAGQPAPTPTKTGLLLEGSGENSDSSFNMAFNSTHFLRQKASSDSVCTSTSKPDLSAWRYGVYNAQGARVAMNGGFPVTFEGEGGRRDNAFAGYWGLMAPPHVKITNGMKVKKHSFGKNDKNATPEEFTVVVAPGKLVKRTPIALTPDELKARKNPLRTFDPTDKVEVEVVFDGSAMIKVKKKSQSAQPQGGMSSSSWEDTTGEFTLREGPNDFFSEAMGQVKIMANASKKVEKIYFYEEELASNSLESTTLYCLIDCLKPGIDTTMVTKGMRDTKGEGPIFADRDTTGKPTLTPSAPKSYSWDAASMSLKAGSEVVKVADSLTSVSGQNAQGFKSGPLVTSLTGITAPKDLFFTTHYVWETGSNSFNKYSGLLDKDGKRISFDRPKFYQYVHKKEFDAVGSDTNNFYGRQFLLRYEGFGQLMGIPNENNGGKEGQHFSPAFTINAGVTIVDSKDKAEYVVKPLEAEERLRKVDASECSGLSLGTMPALPTISLFEDPSKGEPATWSVDDTTSPAVIEGVVQ